MKGPSLLIFTNIGLIIILDALQTSFESPGLRTLTLATANCLIFGLMRLRRMIKDETETSAPLMPILYWSLAYVLGYGLLVYFRESIKISHFIIAKSLAPTIGLYWSGDWKSQKAGLKMHLFNLAPVLLLIEIARFRWEDGFSYISLVFFALVIASFSVSQKEARQVAKTKSPLQAIETLALFNGVLLLILSCLINDLSDAARLLDRIWLPMILAMGIIAIQLAYLSGLTLTRPLLSAVLIASSVPLAVIFESIKSEGSAYPFVLSIIYVLFAALLSFHKNSRQETVNSK